ncbi:MAG: calcium-binding EGF-like domain-containing protein [Gammaproteobacteria bacterium]|nr:calcium-binding EGF-like domain-containing protein [Gammaproteobacteria bacterium]
MTDVNECLEAATAGFDLCSNTAHSHCTNTEGSYGCACNPGYEKLNETCVQSKSGYSCMQFHDPF